MIYFDNAATTMTKPERVTQALLSALVSFGGAGRGVHPASLAAGRAVFEARERIASLLDAPSSSAVSFGKAGLYGAYDGRFAQFSASPFVSLA